MISLTQILSTIETRKHNSTTSKVLKSYIPEPEHIKTGLFNKNKNNNNNLVEIPEHFKKGRLYQELNENENENETNPITKLGGLKRKKVRHYFKNSIESIEDLDNLLDTYDYWSVDIISKELFKFFLKNREKLIKLIENDEKYNYMMNKIHEIIQNRLNIKKLEENITKKNQNNILKNNRLVIQIFYNKILRRLFYILYSKFDTLTINFSREGFLDCLKYAHESYFPWNENTTKVAAENGHLDCLKYAYEKGCSLHTLTITFAAMNGHLDCLKYAYKNGCQWDEYTTKVAAENGHLDCLKYAYENGCQWDEGTTANAARGGHLDCLKYAYENDCRWNIETTLFAALNGHLDCLKYAHENKCPWDTGTTDSAAMNGHLDCLKYAHDNGCLWDKSTTAFAATYGHLNCFEYAYENGCPFDNSILDNLNISIKECIKKIIKIKEKTNVIIKKIEARPKNKRTGQNYMLQLFLQSNNKEFNDIYMERNIREKVKEKVINRLKNRKDFVSLIQNNKNKEKRKSFFRWW